MSPLGVSIPDNAANQWRFQLDDFAKTYKTELAALAWALQNEWQDDQVFLGIDLLPKPHFICCNYSDLESLNQKVQNKIQEVLGILLGCDRQKEVPILVIGRGQLKLLFFQPEPSPADCFAQAGKEIDALIAILETALSSIQLPEAT